MLEDAAAGIGGGSLLDRAHGCLIGGLIGDAVGTEGTEGEGSDDSDVELRQF
jgi:hypothetical protein